MLTLNDYNALIADLYAGPLDAPPWRRFVDRLNQRLDGRNTVLMLRPATPGRAGLMVIAGGVGEAGVASYNQRFFELDPFCNLPPQQAVAISDVISNERLRASVFYREFMQPHDVLHVLGADLAADEAGEDGGRLRITRTHAQRPFDAEDKQTVQLLLPHLVQAMRLRAHMEHIEAERGLYASSFERMQLGAVTLDEEGMVLSLNTQAQELLARGDGLHLQARRLRVDGSEAQRQLDALIATALRGEAPAVRGRQAQVTEAVALNRPSGRARLSALVRALPQREWAESRRHPRAVVYLRDPELRAQGSIEVLRQLFELTRAEAALALLLADGLDLVEIGEHLGIRRNTVRAHLRAIFSKMGVTRQTEVMRLVINSVLPVP